MTKANFINIHTSLLDLNLKVNYTDNSNNENNKKMKKIKTKNKKMSLQKNYRTAETFINIAERDIGKIKKINVRHSMPNVKKD